MADLASYGKRIPEAWLREPLQNVKFGAIADTPDGNGNIVITHGLATTPSVLLVGIESATNAVQVEEVDTSATTSTLRVYALADGSDVTSGAQSGWYIAIK